jgi:phospholipid-binding lipoprotein MlaA
MRHPIRPLLRTFSLLFALAFSSGALASQPVSTIGSGAPSAQAADHPAQAIPEKPIILAASTTDAEDEWDDEDLEFDDDEEMIQPISDPLAPWNRAMTQVNDKIYFWVLKPVTQGYRALVPTPVRIGVKNIFHNITAPARFVACLLQGKGNAAGGEFASFIANSSFGILGIFDLTKGHPELNPPKEDLGQTLGRWGIGNGFYIVWPFLGPSTLRDTFGMVGDRFLDPTTYIEPQWASIGVSGLDLINATSFRIGDYESFKDAAIEPYEAFRDAYIQNRLKSVAE